MTTLTVSAPVDVFLVVNIPAWSFTVSHSVGASLVVTLVVVKVRFPSFHVGIGGVREVPGIRKGGKYTSKFKRHRKNLEKEPGGLEGGKLVAITY